MFIRVNWSQQLPEAYTIYHCDKIYVSGDCNHMQLTLDEGKNEVHISNGDVAFLMNDDGKTIDKIQTFQPPTNMPLTTYGAGAATGSSAPTLNPSGRY